MLRRLICAVLVAQPSLQASRSSAQPNVRRSLRLQAGPVLAFLGVPQRPFQCSFGGSSALEPKVYGQRPASFQKGHRNEYSG